MIRPTFLAFETAKRALNVSQAGLDTVGHNISNAQTPGYTRQRVDQVSLSLNGISQKYQTFGAPRPGFGADIKAINQIRDPYLDTRYRTEAAANGEYNIKDYGLTDINNIFDETTTDGLNKKLSDLLDTLNKLSTKADSPEFATVVRTTASQLASLLNKNAQSLTEAREQEVLDLQSTVADKVNTTLEKIANLNVAIKQDNFYGNPSNDLNDQRNMLLDDLSGYLDIKIVRTPLEVSKGVFVENVNVYLNDGSDPPTPLVESGFNNKLGVNVDPDTGNVGLTLLDGISGFVNKNVGNNGDITSNIFKGALKGYVDIINGAGASAPEGVSTFRGIPYYQASLDEFAQKIATVFNNLNNTTPGDILNNGTNSLYSPTFEKNLFVSVGPEIKSYTGAQNWIGAFNTGTLGFSSATPYTIHFSYEQHPVGDPVLNTVADPVLDYLGNPVSYGDPVLDSTGAPVLDGNGNPTFYSDPVLDASGNPIAPTTILADVTINGQTQQYSAKYTSTGEMSFIGPDGTVGFSITGNGKLPEDGSSIKLDASVKASNITVAKSWMDDPLYITSSKLKPSNEAKTVLSIVGNAPSWLKSVENGNSAIKVPNGNYKFYDDGAGNICVDINEYDTDGNITNTTTYSAPMTDTSTVPPTNKMIAGAKITLTNGGLQGISITLSSTPTLSTDPNKNIVNIKNETAAQNDNVLKFIESMSADNFYGVSGFTGSFHKFMVSFEDDMALDMSTNASLLNTSNTVMSSYADRRDAVSAVSIDEEGINMMTYQNYYNAAARYMNVIDEALDKIINGMGVVGR